MANLYREDATISSLPCRRPACPACTAALPQAILPLCPLRPIPLNCQSSPRINTIQKSRMFYLPYRRSFFTGSQNLLSQIKQDHNPTPCPINKSFTPQSFKNLSFRFPYPPFWAEPDTAANRIITQSRVFTHRAEQLFKTAKKRSDARCTQATAGAYRLPSVRRAHKGALSCNAADDCAAAVLGNSFVWTCVHSWCTMCSLE